MDVEAYLQDYCPSEIVSIVQAADLVSPGDDDVYYLLEEVGMAPKCEVAATLYLAGRIDPGAFDAVIIGFLNSVASLAPLFPDRGREHLTTSLAQFSPNADYGIELVTALRRLGHDDRARLMPMIPIDWTFGDPQDEDALPWHYALYEASLGDMDALERLAEKMRMTVDPNTTVALLESFAQLDHPRATEELRTYVNDTRQTRGANGPDLTVGEFVEALLEGR